MRQLGAVPTTSEDLRQTKAVSRLLVAIVVAAVVTLGFFALSYVLSHSVLSYVTCDGPTPPPQAFDVVDANGCWTYRMPWP